MKNTIINYPIWIIAILLISKSVSQAQAPKSKLTEDFSYQFSQEGGTNASAVAWNPVAKIYVTVIAGNEEFPLEGFDSKGKTVLEYTAYQDGAVSGTIQTWTSSKEMPPEI